MVWKDTLSKTKAFNFRWPDSKLFSFEATVWLLCEIKNAARIDINKLFPLTNRTTPEQKPHIYLIHTPAAVRTKRTIFRKKAGSFYITHIIS